MTTPETVDKPQQAQPPEVANQPQDKQPSGTMFDPETIRKFLDQLKKEDK